MSSATIEALLGRYAPSIPQAAAARDLRCCCGNADCTFLLHSNSALDVLENDVRSAARIGQALLVRHEAYIADAEQERSRRIASVESLEADKKELQAKNAKLAAENAALLQHVESLNNALANSDAQLKSVTASYHSSQHEVQKLNALASRTEQLEAQLTQLESEQAQLQKTHAQTEDERRSISARWGECQRTVVRLQDQMESIEREAEEEKKRHVDFVERMRRTRAVEREQMKLIELEAKEERDRHDEIVERMKKTRTVEKELEHAAGRLKDAAAGNGINSKHRTSSVVSSFVKEILEDNARLHLHMVELQEMITRSTEEIEMLRQQASMPDSTFHETEAGAQPRSLSTELGAEHSIQNISQEPHTYHHYATMGNFTNGSNGKASGVQRSRKRPIITSGKSQPTISSSSSRPSSSENGPSDAVSFGNDSVRRPNRWSGTSHQTRSSIASSGGGSPPSSYCTSTIFELPHDGEPTESSRPTSPESNVWSPPLKPTYKDMSRDVYFETLSPLSESEPDVTDTSTSSMESMPQPDSHPYQNTNANSLIPIVQQKEKITEDILETSQDLSETSSITLRPKNVIANEQFSHRPLFLRRSNSTDSLMSISGMDIHTSAPQLRKRPSHLTAIQTAERQNSGPILTAASASAIRSPLSSAGLDSALAEGFLRSSLGNEGRGSYMPLSDTFGKRVSGWFSGRWSGKAGNRTVSSGDLRGRAVSDDVSARSAVLDERRYNRENSVVTDIIPLSPGSGKQAPALRRVKTGRVLVANLDEDSLKECLEIDDRE